MGFTSELADLIQGIDMVTARAEHVLAISYASPIEAVSDSREDVRQAWDALGDIAEHLGKSLETLMLAAEIAAAEFRLDYPEPIAADLTGALGRFATWMHPIWSGQNNYCGICGESPDYCACGEDPDLRGWGPHVDPAELIAAGELVSFMHPASLFDLGPEAA